MDFAQKIEFPTSFFDDTIKVQVFQNNSTAKVNLLGKATLHLRDLAFNTAMHATGELSIFPLTLRKGQFCAGTVFFEVAYKALWKHLLLSTWPDQLREATCLPDKFEFFNDQLSNEFTDECQFGQLNLELA